MPAHYPTPVEARLLGAYSFLEDHHIPYFKSELFAHFGVCKNRGWAILHNGLDRRYLAIETRGRKPIITPADLQKMEEILWKYGFAARRLTWKALANEAKVEASSRTIERAMGTLQYRKCIACEKGWVSPSNAVRRVKAAHLALSYRPNPEDWYNIRWTHECYFCILQSGKI